MKQHAFLFEPLIIEYLVLEKLCAKASWADKYPEGKPFSNWIRSMGYYRTRTKVEALYYFIECHEKVMHEFEVLERFPSVKRCLKKVIEAVKADLQFIEDLNPRRFFYCKHHIVLKIVMSKRMRRLESMADEGWIAAGDADGLL